MDNVKRRHWSAPSLRVFAGPQDVALEGQTMDLDEKLRRCGMEPGTRAANRLLSVYQRNPHVLTELLDRELQRREGETR
jgi:hypothetical protein